MSASLRRVGVAFALAAFASCTPRATLRPLLRVEPRPARGSDVVVIRDAVVYPATARDLRLIDFDVVLRDGLVASIEPTGGDVPAGARVIDGRGRTVLPGLIDPHVHVLNSGALPWRDVEVPPAHNLEAYLYAGVTTVYDLGGDGDALEKLSDEIVLGHVLGPRLFHTSLPITAEGGHPLPLLTSVTSWPVSALAPLVVPQAKSPAEADALVDAQLAHHGDYVKLIRDTVPTGSPELDDATLAALVQAAHARHKRVFVHVGSADDAMAAVRAGADVLAHAVYRGRITRAQAEEIAHRRVKVISTLASFRRLAAIAHHTFAPTPYDDDVAPAEVLAPITGALARDLPADTEAIAQDAARDEALWVENLRTLHDAGVELLPGSDSVLFGIPAGTALVDDMRMLVDAGLSPSDVIYEATAGAARLWLTAPSFGTLEPGKAADVVVVDGDPFADIDALTRVACVIRAGRVLSPIRPPAPPPSESTTSGGR